jgi:hypothetical protein
MSEHTPAPITAAQVGEFLRNNPDFFVQHEQLLADINLPHRAGEAVSLVERQVSLLRERNIDMRHRLAELIEVARDNDALFEKTKNLILNIVAAKDLDALANAVQIALKEEFHADVSALTLFAPAHEKLLSRARVVPLHEAQESIKGILSSSRAVCGTLRPQEISFLFPGQTEQVGSAAVAPLGNGEVVGVLAVGSYDPNHYRANMGTMFLTYVSDILNVVLPRFID